MSMIHLATKQRMDEVRKELSDRFRAKFRPLMSSDVNDQLLSYMLACDLLKAERAKLESQVLIHDHELESMSELQGTERSQLVENRGRAQLRLEALRDQIPDIESQITNMTLETRGRLMKEEFEHPIFRCLPKRTTERARYLEEAQQVLETEFLQWFETQIAEVAKRLRQRAVDSTQEHVRALTVSLYSGHDIVRSAKLRIGFFNRRMHQLDKKAYEFEADPENFPLLLEDVWSGCITERELADIGDGRESIDVGNGHELVGTWDTEYPVSALGQSDNGHNGHRSPVIAGLGLGLVAEI